MSEIRINIIDDSRAVSGESHSYLAEALVASLAAGPGSIEELRDALQRYIPNESDWSPLRHYRLGADLAPFDAGVIVIDLRSRVVGYESGEIEFGADGTIDVETTDGERFALPFRLPDDWEVSPSVPPARLASLPEPDVPDPRAVLFGHPLFDYIASEAAANRGNDDEDLIVEIHARWLMTPREDLGGRTPREVLFRQRAFISFDLHTRALQWSFTGRCPPPLERESSGYANGGFGSHEIILYYYLTRFLLAAAFAGEVGRADVLAKLADEWLRRPHAEFSHRSPADIIDSERRRFNLTMSPSECFADEDCEICRMMAADLETPVFWHLDGCDMEFDRFEFSMADSFEEFEEEQRSYEEMSRRFAA